MASIQITYYYCGDSYAAGFFFAVLAVFITKKCEKPLSAVLGGAFCLMLSLSIYQINLGVAAVLSIGVLSVHLIEKHLEGFWKLFLRLLCMGLGGTGAYYAVLKGILFVNGWEMASYRGADKIGFSYILSNVWTGIRDAYVDFAAFFFDTAIMVNSYGVRLFYAALFLLFALAAVKWMWDGRRHAAEPLVLAFLLAAVPVACNVIEIFAPGNRIDLRTCGGMVVLVPLMLLMLNNPSPIGRCAVGLLAACLVWAYILIDNNRCPFDGVHGKGG